MLLDEGRHFSALERLSLRLLAEGKVAQAFRLADRRCRISPIAEAYHYTLRGEISHLLGDPESAIADVKRALDLAPDDLSANRRMMAWGEGQAQIDAARRLLAVDHDDARIARAIAVLRSAGQRAFAKVDWTDDEITGWAAWDRPQRAQLAIESDGESIVTWLTADPEHPLAESARHAADFTLKRPRSSAVQRFSLFAGRTALYKARLSSNARESAQGELPKKNPSRRPASDKGGISVIVPVYGDFEATKACFESLMLELKAHGDARLIIIDDASEDTRIKDFLGEISGQARVRLLINDENLGFAESVNRGLAETGRDDVILLNADTVVPPGVLARLHMAAHSVPGIGTLTPLSNNGEFTSFPVPYRLNPLPAYEEICEIDAAAARANAHHVIDMPNGIGFCLYVTRNCLDVVGDLSTVFRRGYFEDVDLCLRAREAGFRNVCAVSVYVGHAGSRSFGSEKRSLVVRNLATMDQRYPSYRPECAAFVEADPLRGAREAVERELGAYNQGATLLLCGAGPSKSIAETRAAQLEAKGERVILAAIRMTLRGPAMKLSCPSKSMPQSIRFDLATDIECTAALDYLNLVQPARIEVAQIAKLPSTILDWVLGQRAPIDLLIADGALLCPRGGFVRSDGGLCDAPRTKRLCDECLFGLGDRDFGEPAIAGPSVQDALLQAARNIYVPDRWAKSFASRFLGRRKITEIGGTVHPIGRSSDAATPVSGQSIGFVAIGTGASEHTLMKETARILNRELPERSVVVIGQTFGDLDFIKLDNVYVTGAVDPDEYDRILRQYEIDALFVPVKQPLFGHPKIADLSERRPTAFFDWSFGDVPPPTDDLPLNPYLNADELATFLVPWLLRFQSDE
jgi:O-antigen biosynthesis protein